MSSPFRHDPAYTRRLDDALLRWLETPGLPLIKAMEQAGLSLGRTAMADLLIHGCHEMLPETLAAYERETGSPRDLVQMHDMILVWGQKAYLLEDLAYGPKPENA